MAIHRNGVVSHVGLVLGGTSTHWNDSMHITSYYTRVWDAATNSPQNVYVRDDFGNAGHFEVDATPEVLAAYDAYQADVKALQIAAIEAREFARVGRGKTVQVNRGRKVPKGTTGLVFWIGDNGYGVSVGILTDAGEKHFTAVTNVDVVTLPEGQLTKLTAMQDASKAQWLASNSPRTRVNDYTKPYGRKPWQRRYA